MKFVKFNSASRAGFVFAAAALAASATFAGGTHGGGHDESPIGEAGVAALLLTTAVLRVAVARRWTIWTLSIAHVTSATAFATLTAAVLLGGFADGFLAGGEIGQVAAPVVVLVLNVTRAVTAMTDLARKDIADQVTHVREAVRDG